jgi:predicted adenylyl cyclase CyaB
MAFINIEIKARCEAGAHQRMKAFLEKENADYRGLDHQIDTYFRVANGRLKLREGRIENHLIHYQRQNQAGPKQSDVILYESRPDHVHQLKSILEASLGVLTIVDKQRHIYFIDNVKFHLDEVRGLGQFAEIEAIDTRNERNHKELLRQCESYIKALGIQQEQLISDSYSDILLKKPDAALPSHPEK